MPIEINLLDNLLQKFINRKADLYNIFIQHIELLESSEKKLALLDGALDEQTALCQIFSNQCTAYGYYIGCFFKDTNTIHNLKQLRSKLIIEKDFEFININSLS